MLFLPRKTNRNDYQLKKTTMNKFKKMVLMLYFALSGALCYAHGEVGTENENGKDGTPIEVIKIVVHGSSDKSGSISPNINGHVLAVAFNENLGQVSVEVTTVAGTPVQFLSTPTPNGVQVYILNAGDYIITFKLSNGDEYYGEFTVSD